MIADEFLVWFGRENEGVLSHFDIRIFTFRDKMRECRISILLILLSRIEIVQADFAILIR